MLDYLGVPYVQSEGEAEAMCAYLDKEGVSFFCKDFFEGIQHEMFSSIVKRTNFSVCGDSFFP